MPVPISIHTSLSCLPRDIVNDLLDNVRYYYTSTTPISSFCSVSRYSEWLRECVLEVKHEGGDTKWYFFDFYAVSMRKAELRFKSGSSIQNACVAVVYVDGKPVLKYSYTGEDNAVFTNAGKEAGLYNGADGEMELDGCGYVYMNGKEGTYTYKSADKLLTVVFGEETI